MKDNIGLIRTLKIISIKTKRIINKRLYDITDIQMFILEFINQKRGDTYQKDIENILGVRRSTTTEILNTMEKNNLIRRMDCDLDKRKKIIVLSSLGKEYISLFNENILNVENSLLLGISDNDRNIFFKVLDKIKNNINEMEEIC